MLRAPFFLTVINTFYSTVLLKKQFFNFWGSLCWFPLHSDGFECNISSKVFCLLSLDSKWIQTIMLCVIHIDCRHYVDSHFIQKVFNILATIVLQNDTFHVKLTIMVFGISLYIVLFSSNKIYLLKRLDTLIHFINDINLK